MKRLDQRGISNALIVPVIGLGILVIILVVVAIYQFLALDTARNERDAFATAKIEEAREETEAELQAEFDEKEKSPFSDFDGPDLLGGISFKYPKTWSASLEQNESGRTQLDAYFHPDVIRFDNEDDRSYALRLELLDNDYSSELKRYQTAIKNGELKSRAVTFSGVEGVRLDGQLDDADRGSVVLVPLRDKTIVIWTESTEFVGDYNTILESFTFNP